MRLNIRRQKQLKTGQSQKLSLMVGVFWDSLIIIVGIIKRYTPVVQPMYPLILELMAEKNPWTGPKSVKKPVKVEGIAYVDFKKGFKLNTDTSTTGLGAVLYQGQDRKDRVINYASHSLSKSEARYPAHKLEFTERFYKYLYGKYI